MFMSSKTYLIKFILFVFVKFKYVICDDKCSRHTDCSGIFTLNNYCCLKQCCNWFQFLIEYNKNELGDIDFKGPTVQTILLMVFIGLLVVCVGCVIGCIVCCCKCCQCCGCSCFATNKKQQQQRVRLYHENRNLNEQSVRLYSPPLVVAQPQPLPRTTVPNRSMATNTAPVVGQHYLTQDQINRSSTRPTAPSLAQFEQPLLPSRDEQQQQRRRVQPSAPPEQEYSCNSSESHDRPPDYDELVKSGVVMTQK